MCYAEYRGFFHIGMITRNERNAIIQHGTMTMVRRTQLDNCRWAEWCITEDAELGLRIFERGFDATYVPEQLRPRPDARHLHRLQEAALPLGLRRDADPQGARARAVPRGRPAVPGQRYHFIAGWLPWIADGCNMLFNLAALGWSAAMVWAPHADRPAAGDVLGAAAVAVHLQARQAGAPVPRAGRRQRCARPSRRRSPGWR